MKRAKRPCLVISARYLRLLLPLQPGPVQQTPPNLLRVQPSQPLLPPPRPLPDRQQGRQPLGQLRLQLQH